MTVYTYFLDALITEVGAYDHVGYNRIPITFYVGLEIKFEAGSPLTSFPLEDKRFIRFDAVVGIGKRKLSLCALIQGELLVGKIFDLVEGRIQLLLENRVRWNGKPQRRPYIPAQRSRDQIDAIRGVDRFAIRKAGHRPFRNHGAPVRHRGRPMVRPYLD